MAVASLYSIDAKQGENDSEIQADTLAALRQFGIRECAMRLIEKAEWGGLLALRANRSLLHFRPLQPIAAFSINPLYPGSSERLSEHDLADAIYECGHALDRYAKREHTSIGR